MDRNGYKSSLFILVLKGINENERFSSNVLLCSTFEYQEKINKLLSEFSNRVQSSDLIGSIAWAPDDVYPQVFGNERNGHVRGVGFGPTSSMHPAKSTPTIAQERSQERDAEVTQLKNQVAFLTKKVNGYENLEERVTQLMQLVQNQQNHSSKASQVLNFNVLRIYLVFKIFKYSNYYFVTRNDFFIHLLDTLNLYSGWFRFRSTISNSLQITGFIPSRNYSGTCNVLRTP